LSVFSTNQIHILRKRYDIDYGLVVTQSRKHADSVAEMRMSRSLSGKLLKRQKNLMIY